MKPPRFEYSAPATLADAVAALASSEDAKVLAGGQSLIPLLNFRLAMPSRLVDINRLPDLDRVYERDGGIAVSALVRQADAERSELLRAACPLLPQALRLVAHPVIRNRGTVVGSLVHADPAAELPAVLLVLGGRLRVRSSRGEREIEARDLYTGVFETSLDPDELAVEAWFPRHPGPFAIREESRRHGDFALAGAVRAGERLALFGVAPTPVLADARDPVRGLQPSGDLEATADFRRHLAGVLAERVMAA